MTGFHISSHGRLQDWIADEQGYFTEQGLEYELDVRLLQNADQDIDAPRPGDVRVGAYELYQSGGGGKKDMSCACHWAVNQAAVDAAGRMWGHAYSILPSAIYLPAGSEIGSVEELAGVEVAVGYHSGSHFSTIQALEACLRPDQIALSFVGMPYDRVDALLAGDVAAAALWGASTYLAEQRGARKLIDTTFMAGFMFNADTDPDDVERYFAGLRRAQMDLDFAPERHKHHFLKEIPTRYHDTIDVRGFGTGERVVFLPYTEQMWAESQRWMQDRDLFKQRGPAPAYESVVQL